MTMKKVWKGISDFQHLRRRWMHRDHSTTALLCWWGFFVFLWGLGLFWVFFWFFLFACQGRKRDEFYFYLLLRYGHCSWTFELLLKEDAKDDFYTLILRAVSIKCPTMLHFAFCDCWEFVLSLDLLVHRTHYSGAWVFLNSWEHITAIQCYSDNMSQPWKDYCEHFVVPEIHEIRSDGYLWWAGEVSYSIVPSNTKLRSTQLVVDSLLQQRILQWQR